MQFTAANRYATQLTVKAAGGPVVETKSTTTTARRRLFHTVACSLCGQPAAAALRPVPSALTAFCIPCRDAMVQRGADAGHLDPADLDALDQLDELTAEEEYEQSLDNQQEWHLDADGTLARGPRDAWTPDSESGRRP